MAASSSIVSGSYDTAVLATSGLVSYWKLADPSGTTAADSKDSNPGTYNGGFTLSQTPPSGDMSNGTLFNGSTGRVNVPNASNINPASALTMECWVKFAAVSADQVLIESGWSANSSPFNSYGLYLLGSSNKLHATVTTSSTQHDTGGTTALTTGVWHHVVGVYDGAHITLYVDGSQEGTPTAATGNITYPGTAQPLEFASINRGGTTGAFLNGTLAACAVYNTALSAATILNHYNLGIGAAQSDFGNVSYLSSADASAGAVLFSWWLNVAAWDASNQTFLHKTDFSTHGYWARRNSTNDALGWNVVGTGEIVTTGVSFAGQGWIHCAVLMYGLGIQWYINGTSQTFHGGTYSNNGAFGGSDDLVIYLNSSNIAIADYAVFSNPSGSSTGLTDLVGMLSKGFDPLSLIGFTKPLVASTFLGGGTAEPDVVSGASGVVGGNWSQVAGPRLFGRSNPDFDGGPTNQGGLFLPPDLTGLGSGGPFFKDRLAG